MNLTELLPTHMLQVILEAPLHLLQIPTWPYIMVPHSFNTCAGLRPFARREFWLLNLICTLMASFGSTMLFCLVAHTHPLFLYNSSVILMVILIWWLVNFSPFDIVWRLYHWPPIRAFLQLVAAVNRCRSVCMGFDKGRELFGGAASGMFCMAVLAGLSGGLVTAWVKKLLWRAGDPQVATEFSRPTWIAAAALLGATWLYVVEQLRLVPITALEARAVYMCVAVTHALLEPFVGVGFVPYPLSPLLQALLVLLGIPTTNGDPSIALQQPSMVKKEKTHVN